MLVVANLVPLAGVLLLGWQLTTLLAVYWAENGVVGVFAVARMLTARGSGQAASAPTLLMVPFFCLHYGVFWVVHGLFVWLAFPFLFGSGAAPSRPDPAVVLAASVALFASHGASFVLNWLGGGEYRTSTPAAEMAAPYSRVMVLHFTIVLGAFAVSFVGSPLGALVVMVVLKTWLDLAAHLAERQRAWARAQQAGTPAPGSATVA